jgi:molecular chaperone GrpE
VVLRESAGRRGTIQGGTVTVPRDDDRARREEPGTTGGGDWRGQAPRPVGSQRFGAEEPVVRDKRRVDPETGAARPEAARKPAAERTQQSQQPQPDQPAQDGSGGPAKPAGAAAAASPAAVPSGTAGDLQAQLAERTADLQRLQAEYVNYRRRVDRDRESVRELAVIAVLNELLPALDDIGRARDHGELEGGFKSVAESIEGTVGKLGLERFGTAGELFDPTVHEALMHTYSSEVAEPTCVEILQPGYRVGTRVIRPARVTVAEPQGGESGPAS